MDRNLLELDVSCGGGVFIASKTSLGAIDISPDILVDQLFIKITLAHTKIILGFVYLSPNSHTQAFLEHVNCVEALFNKYSYHKFILMGDYNLPKVLWNSNSPLQ